MHLFLHNLTADITRRWTPFDKQEILKYRLFTYYTKQSKSHDLQRYTKHLLNDKTNIKRYTCIPIIGFILKLMKNNLTVLNDIHMAVLKVDRIKYIQCTE